MSDLEENKKIVDLNNSININNKPKEKINKIKNKSIDYYEKKYCFINCDGVGFEMEKDINTKN